MQALVKLQVKENLRRNAFILFAVFGVLVTGLFFLEGDFAVNGQTLESPASRYGFEWQVLSFLASLGAVSLTMGTVEKHRSENRSDLLTLHGLGRSAQYQAMALGNMALALVMGLLLTTGLLLQVLFAGAPTSPLGLVLAYTAYLAGVGLVALLVSLFSLILPPVITAFLSILMVAIGFFQGVLLSLAANAGGLFGTLLQVLLRICPPLDLWSQVTRDLFLQEGPEVRSLLTCLAYAWMLILLYGLLSKGVARYEG